MRVEPFWTTNENGAFSRPRVVTLPMPSREIAFTVALVSITARISGASAKGRRYAS